MDRRLDHRLQEHGSSIERASADGHRARDLESHVVGIDRVVLAVEQGHPDVDHRITRHHALGHRVDDSLLHRGPEVLGDRAAEDLVLPDETFAARGRADLDDTDAVLPVASRLLDVATFGAGLAVHGLAIWNAGRGGGRFDTIFALQLLEDHVEVYIAQA